MCTIIAIPHPNRAFEFFFFANRDRPPDPFRGNYLKFIPENKVLGVHDIRSKGLACGYSLKSGLYAAVANVGAYRGSKSRGVLLKQILTEARSLLDAISMLERELVNAEYSSASYLLGRLGENWLFENLGRTVYSERLEKSRVLTNFFIGLKGEASKEARARRDYVNRNLSRFSTVDVEDILQIVAHHSNKDGICRHGITLASLFIAGRGDRKPKILYRIGESCQGLQNVLNVYPDLRGSIEF